MSKPLLIVESPTKAKTITKFLGKDYTVLSSFGHIRDLPKSKTGVDVEHNYEPTYEIPAKSKKTVAELKSAAAKASEVFLASDHDREGEAIAWHVANILKLDPEAQDRITYHEITQHAIDEAVKHPRKIDMDLVNAQQARRILDRLVGYELSPFLWKKVQRGLSAGRVQSVAVRLIVERERERQAFKIDEYWSIDALFNKDGQDFEGKLLSRDGKSLEKLAINNEQAAQAIVADLADAKYEVTSVEKKEIKKSPSPPFTTSTLQIEANNKLGFSAKQTMRLAQKLYETGRITYMRTDSLNLSEKFLGEAQEYLKKEFGDQYAIGAQHYKTKAKGAQEAHEAIRPTEANRSPEKIGNVDAQSKKLYELIWRRALASQMPPAILERTGVDITAKKYGFRANGNIIKFDGYMKVYRGAKEKLLPKLTKGDEVLAKTVTPNQHFTEPPARYSDASLVKALEEFGVGRPSTYAPTIGTIIDRGYIDRDDNKKLFPNDIANIVTDVLVEHFPNIVDYKFTAKMEKSLDDVAEGKEAWVPMLDDFYKPFHKNIEEKSEKVSRDDVMKEREVGKDPKTGLMLIARNGRFGPYIQLGEWAEADRKEKKNKPKSASLEKGMSIDTVTVEQALQLLVLPRVVGKTAAGEEIVADKGRFGPYLRAGEVTATLKEQDPRTITLEEALQLLKESEERKKKMATPIAELGEDPKTKGQILVKFGRYGYYVTDGETNASIKKADDPQAVTRAMAIEMLEKKRLAPKRSWGKKK
ncbi:type I DNA topoisomerase [Patescibacteria group bacterium]|nr:type I DNA topoisomerase [Patescibacteria group bacterium]